MAEQPTLKEKRQQVCQLTCNLLSVARVAKMGEERRLVKQGLAHAKHCPRCQSYVRNMQYLTVQDLEDEIKEQWVEADKLVPNKQSEVNEQ